VQSETHKEHKAQVLSIGSQAAITPHDRMIIRRDKKPRMVRPAAVPLIS